MDIPGSGSGSRDAGGEPALGVVVFSALLPVGRTASRQGRGWGATVSEPQTQELFPTAPELG